VPEFCNFEIHPCNNNTKSQQQVPGITLKKCDKSFCFFSFWWLKASSMQISMTLKVQMGAKIKLEG